MDRATASPLHLSSLLIASLLEVVGERLNSLCRVAGLNVGAVVADEDGLFRLHDDDTGLVLL